MPISSQDGRQIAGFSQPAAFVVPVATGSTPRQMESQNLGLLHRIAFYCTVILLFLHFTRLHEVLTTLTGINSRVLYVFFVPAMLGFVLSGGLRRAFSGRPVVYWTAFTIWMILATSTSIWRTDSVEAVFSFLRANYTMLLLLAGLSITWKQCRILLLTLGLAGVANLIIATLFVKDWGDRLGTEFATLGNPTDLAGILVLLIPMIVYLVFYPPPVKILWRVVGVAFATYGLYRILASASRGALIALVASFIIVLIKANARQRILMIVFTALSFAVIIPLVPQSSRDRLLSYSSQLGSQHEEVESAWIRQRLFEETVSTTLSHPIFGVGPNEFGNFEGDEKEKGGKQIVGWGNAHNSYMQIAADTGIPGFLLYVAATVSMFLLIQRSWKKARMAHLSEQANACFFLFLGCAGFCVAIFFLNFGYLVFLPAMAGISVAVMMAVDREISLQTPAATTIPAPASIAAPQIASPNRFRFGRYR